MIVKKGLEITSRLTRTAFGDSGNDKGCIILILSTAHTAEQEEKRKYQGHKSECLWEYGGGAREVQKVRDFTGTVKSEKKGL